MPRRRSVQRRVQIIAERRGKGALIFRPHPDGINQRRPQTAALRLKETRKRAGFCLQALDVTLGILKRRALVRFFALCFGQLGLDLFRLKTGGRHLPSGPFNECFGLSQFGRPDRRLLEQPQPFFDAFLVLQRLFRGPVALLFRLLSV